MKEPINWTDCFIAFILGVWAAVLFIYVYLKYFVVASEPITCALVG